MAIEVENELAYSYGFSKASFYKIKQAYEKNRVQALVSSKKEPLAKQAALVYNLLRKLIGHEFRFALSKILA